MLGGEQAKKWGVLSDAPAGVQVGMVGDDISGGREVTCAVAADQIHVARNAGIALDPTRAGLVLIVK